MVNDPYTTFQVINCQTSQFLLESKSKIPYYISPKDSSPPTIQPLCSPFLIFNLQKFSQQKNMCTKNKLKNFGNPSNNERKNIGRISASPLIFLAAHIEMVEIVAVQLATIIIWENGGCVTTKRITNLLLMEEIRRTTWDLVKSRDKRQLPPSTGNLSQDFWSCHLPLHSSENFSPWDSQLADSSVHSQKSSTCRQPSSAPGGRHIWRRPSKSWGFSKGNPHTHTPNATFPPRK